MQDIEMIAMQLIVSAGNSKSCFIEAMAEAEKRNFDKADELVKEGVAAYAGGHEAHAKLLAMSAGGELNSIPLLLIHAEDQMMNCETMEIVARQVISLYRENTALKEERSL